MFYTALILQLRDGCLDAYRTAHEQLWPDVAEGLRNNGVDMVTYHHQGLLFIFASAPSEESWLRSRQDPSLAGWSIVMAKLLQTDAQGNIIFHSPEKAFGFGKFA
jgi:L-rhamnose mutarotase